VPFLSCADTAVLRGSERAPDGKAQLDEAIQHRIADRTAHFFREDNRSLWPAGSVPAGWKLYSRRRGRHMRRAEVVDFDWDTIDVDLDDGRAFRDIPIVTPAAFMQGAVR
jgi:hypothetical protein